MNVPHSLFDFGVIDRGAYVTRNDGEITYIKAGSKIAQPDDLGGV
jgi:hypothetical protein